MITITRGLHLAAMLSLLGSAGFMAWILPAAQEPSGNLYRALRRLGWISGCLALLTGAIWFAAEAATIADATSPSEFLDALPTVALHTRYGTIMVLRLGLLAAATATACRSSSRISLWAGVALTACALGLQGTIGHAGATPGTTSQGLVLSESLHLIAAGIWLGALIPLFLSLRLLPPAKSAAICERFSPIGLACVLLLAGTGVVQGLQLIGSFSALAGTPYGHIALLKIALFLVALVLATVNRFRLTDRLAAGEKHARKHLLLSVGCETVVGLAIVTAAAFLASSTPAIHLAPVWPLSWRFSLVNVNKDPNVQREIILTLVAFGGAVLILLTALLRHRYRLAAFAVLVVAIVLRGPSLSLLTVEASPGPQTSPTGFAATSIVHGQAVFAQNCAACHGAGGAGNGPAAEGLPIKPADLTMPHIWHHSDSQMFDWLTHGIKDPKGNPAMPGFGDALSVTDRWALIDYVRAHNAGVNLPENMTFDRPVRAPNFPITCNGVAASRMSELRGHPVDVVTTDSSVSQSDLPAVVVDLRGKSTPGPHACVAADSSAWGAYAVLAGLAADKFAGSAFLVDADQWLRAAHRAGTAGGWETEADLSAAIRAISAHPNEQPGGAQHEDHH